MAPRGRRGEAAEPQGFHQLGVRGRKTGVALTNTGEVDDQGFQPLDSIFSSPQKGPARANGSADVETDEDDDDAGSADMEITSSAGPGPRTLLKNQRNSQYQLPRSRSPVKTRLTSPPKRNIDLQRLSSPSRPERDLTVTRQLDFSGQAKRGRPNGVNGAAVEEESESDGGSQGADDDVDDVDEVDDVPQAGGTISDDEQSLSADDPETEPEPEPEPVEPSPSARKGRGRPKAAAAAKEAVEASSPSAKKRGRPARTEQQPTPEKPQDSHGPKKRQTLRTSTGSEQEVEQEPQEPEERQTKRQKTTKEPAKPAPAKRGRKPSAATAASAAAKANGPPKPRGRPAGRKPKQAGAAATEGDDAGEASFMALQKGPPMPKRPGLVSMRRDPDEIRQTKSGRQSFKPLAWWAGEQIITEDEEQTDMFKNGSGFVLNSMKEIIRVDDEEPPRGKRPGPRSRGRPKTKPKMQPVREEEEEEELEEWEADPGAVMSEVIAWEPEYETHPPGDDDQVHISEEQIALSGHAVETREIRDATFRFAKTLTMPFMGAGVVDLPPGAEKRPKNSRKMHMVFFVHTGKVAVTVNEGHFRISKGGQWFVPRGNYYSISNDYQQPARIFFAQACESLPQISEASESMLIADGS